MTRILSDGEVMHFTNSDLFASRLQEVEANTKWIQRTLTEISVDEKRLNDDEESEAQKHTRVEGTRLMLCPRGIVFSNDDYIPLRACSIQSLYQRVGLGGDVLKRIDAKGVHQFTELALLYAPKNADDIIVKMPVVEGKINAFLSENYVDSLPTAMVFEEFKNRLESISNSSNLEFKGSWSYPVTTGWYKLPELRNVNGSDFNVVVGLTTSDAGYSGINFNAYLTNQDVTCLPLMSTLSIEHRGKTNYVKFEEELSMLTTVIDNGINHLTDMMTLQIKNPINTMKRAAKKCGLPKRDVLEKLDQLHHVPTNAFDCYLTLSRILSKDEDGNVNERVQGDVTKLLGIDWNKLDLPGDFAW